MRYYSYMKKWTVSLVITVKDDTAGLLTLLAQIAQQTVLPTEVIVIVADVVDQTTPLLSIWHKQHPQLSVRWQWLPGINRAQGRNRGVAMSTNTIIAFIDVGCRPEHTWLAELLLPFSKEPFTQLVSGLTKGEFSSVWEQAQIPYVLVAPEHHAAHPLPATRNMAVLRTTFLESGGFPAQLNYAEDFAWSRSLAAQGIYSTLATKAVVYWQPRPHLAAFFIMIMRLTAGDRQAGIIRPGLLSVWLRYALFVIIGLMVWLIWHNFFFVSFILVITIGVYLMAKLIKLRIFTWPLIGVTMLTQLASDIAVMAGSLLGEWPKRTHAN